MSKLQLALVGCGGMGHRHLHGLAELYWAGLCAFELVGACDPVRENAESLAAKTEEYFGKRPTVAANLEELQVQQPNLNAVDICADPRHHHTLACDALSRGWHAMVEKPMGLTARACNLMVRSSAIHRALVLSVAENYRRDPIKRLAKALLDAGVIGAPRFLMHNSIGGSDKMLISEWRHQKNSSGVLLDVGVHFTDMMEYLLGDIVSVYAQTRLHERIRKNPLGGSEQPASPSGTTPFYEKWQRQMPAEFEATAEDAAYATLLFANGVVGQYIEEHAAHGKGLWQRIIYGSKGTLELPGDRSGHPIALTLDGGETINDERILDFVPDFRLDDATTKLFGGERLWRYDFPFTETDRKIIAIEYADFADAILSGRPPEVDATQGARSVAISYAMLESGVAGRVVTVDEVLSERVDEYQREINESLGIA